MSRGDDLASVFAGLRPEGPAFGFRQATVLTFNQASGAGTYSLAGTVLTDLPLLSSGESLELKAGDAVILLRQGPTFFVLGRVVNPGGVLAPSAIGTSAIGQSATGFELSTAWTDRVSGVVTVPPWANRALVHATCDMSVENTSTSLDYVYLRALIAGTPGGNSRTAVAAAGAFPERFASLGASAIRTMTVTGGSTFTVAAGNRTNTVAWAADAGNIINLNATIIFTRV